MFVQHFFPIQILIEYIKFDFVKFYIYFVNKLFYIKLQYLKKMSI